MVTYTKLDASQGPWSERPSMHSAPDSGPGVSQPGSQARDQAAPASQAPHERQNERTHDSEEIAPGEDVQAGGPVLKQAAPSSGNACAEEGRGWVDSLELSPWRVRRRKENSAPLSPGRPAKRARRDAGASPSTSAPPGSTPGSRAAGQPGSSPSPGGHAFSQEAAAAGRCLVAALRAAGVSPIGISPLTSDATLPTDTSSSDAARASDASRHAPDARNLGFFHSGEAKKPGLSVVSASGPSLSIDNRGAAHPDQDSKDPAIEEPVAAVRPPLAAPAEPWQLAGAGTLDHQDCGAEVSPPLVQTLCQGQGQTTSAAAAEGGDTAPEQAAEALYMLDASAAAASEKAGAAPETVPEQSMAAHAAAQPEDKAPMQNPTAVQADRETAPEQAMTAVNTSDALAAAQLERASAQPLAQDRVLGTEVQGKAAIHSTSAQPVAHGSLLCTEVEVLSSTLVEAASAPSQRPAAPRSAAAHAAHAEGGKHQAGSAAVGQDSRPQPQLGACCNIPSSCTQAVAPDAPAAAHAAHAAGGQRPAGSTAALGAAPAGQDSKPQSPQRAAGGASVHAGTAPAGLDSKPHSQQIVPDSAEPDAAVHISQARSQQPDAAVHITLRPSQQPLEGRKVAGSLPGGVRVAGGLPSPTALEVQVCLSGYNLILCAQLGMSRPRYQAYAVVSHML